MKTHVAPLSRSFCTLVSRTFWTSFVVAGWAGLSGLIAHWNRTGGLGWIAPDRLGGAFWVILGIILLIAVPGILSALVSIRARYDIGARDLTVREGGLRRVQRNVPIDKILRVSISTGPLMRLLGLSDLEVQGDSPSETVTIEGVRDAEELRRLLLERAESLREAAREEERASGRTPQEIVLSRLTTAVERLEKRIAAQESK